MGSKALIYGCGFTGEAFARRLLRQGWRVAGVSRSAERRAALAALGVEPLAADDAGALVRAAGEADAVVAAAPPGAQGCPALRAFGPVLAGRPHAWAAYLSTTGVYGDRAGGWVDEGSSLDARSLEGVRRVEAESDWRALADRGGFPLAVLRLPGIYGPGRSPFDRLREGRAHRLDKPGHVFSRIHVDDLAAALDSALARRASGAFNVCDDQPAPAADVTACAARLLGLDPPPLQAFETATLSPMAQRFWSESKRVSNAHAKAALGWRPAYRGYAEGLAAVLAAEAHSSPAA